jgi:hypothetical protein
MTAPDSQLFNLPSVSRLVTILDVATECGVICKLESEVAGGLDGSMERRSEWAWDVKQGFSALQ